jgi:PAS domain S-box-containing protein
MEENPDNDSQSAEIKRLQKLVDSYKEKYEKELYHSQKLDLYTSLTPVAIIDWDFNLKLEYCNNAAEISFGQLELKMLGKFPWDFVSEKEKDEITLQWKKQLETPNLFNFIANYTTKSGKHIICKWRNAPVFQNQKLVGFTSVIIDISAEKQAQLELIDSKERFETLSSVTSEAIFLTEDGYGIDVNQAGIKMFGYSPEEVKKMSATDIIAKDFKEIVKANILNNYLEPYEAKGLKKNGTEFPIEIKGRNFVYKGRNIRVTSIRDITQRKKAEDELKQNEIKFRTIFDNADFGVLVGDSNRKIIDANKNFCKMSGYPKQEMVGKTIEFLFGKETLTKTPFRFDLVESGDVVQLERTIVTKKGRQVPVEMTSKFVIDRFYISIFTDLTDRKKSEKALHLANLKLKDAKDRAEESNQLKTAFLQNMSHEIRTPMNGIIGFSEMLSSHDITEERRNYYADIIVKSSKRLLDIVNDILDISKLESREVILVENKVNLNVLLNELFNFYQPQAWKKNLNLHINLPLVKNKCNMVVDDQKLRQIISNLLSNAIKFTEEGYIRFGYEVNDGKVLFYVEDSGIGIASDMHDKIFERFRQAELTTTRRYGGTGLGLSISQAYAKLLKGKLRLKSEEGKGSTFYFSIPFKQEVN